MYRHVSKPKEIECICRQCHKIFMTASKKTVYCSLCKKERDKERRKEYQKQFYGVYKPEEGRRFKSKGRKPHYDGATMIDHVYMFGWK